MPRLLNLSNKTPFVDHLIPESPTDEDGNPLSPLKAPFQLSNANAAPETVLRPSRARTSLRMPRISDGSTHANIPRTPDPSGQKKHWDAPLFPDLGTEIDVDSPDVSGAVNSIDYEEEVEYMPPKVQG